MNDKTTHPWALVALLLCLGMSLGATASRADETGDKYRITRAEKVACTADAMRLCMDAYPSEDRLLSCMKVNRGSLSTTCRVAFDAGVRRRHL